MQGIRTSEGWKRQAQRAVPILGPIAMLAAATLGHVLALWPMSRLLHRPISALLMKWDAGWYLHLAKVGYPRHLPPPPHGESTAGFYPLYPIIVRAALHTTPLGDHAASLGVAIVLSALAMVVLWQLTARLCDESVAHRAVAFTVFAPAAFVLSMGYSEGLLILLASATLLMLLDQRWLLAGCFAGLACLSRPSGVAAAVACAVAAFVALREHRRDLRPLLAPVLAAIGFVAVPVYDQIHMGDAFAYWKTQKRGWHESFDGGVSTIRSLIHLAAHPLRDFNILFAGLAMVVLTVGIVLLVRWRPPAPILAYSAVIAILTFGASSFASTFRFVLVGFPFTIAYARTLKNNAFAIALAISAMLFVTLAIAASTNLYTP